MCDTEQRLQREQRDAGEARSAVNAARERIRELEQQLVDARAERDAALAGAPVVYLADEHRLAFQLRAAVVRAREAFHRTGAYEDVVRAILTP